MTIDSIHCYSGFPLAILYPMRMRDFRRFGFADVLNLGQVTEE